MSVWVAWSYKEILGEGREGWKGEEGYLLGIITNDRDDLMALADGRLGEMKSHLSTSSEYDVLHVVH
jgi:hypothetical protein